MTKNSTSACVWMSWGAVIAFYAYQYILRVIPNVLLPYIQEKFGLDAVAFGQFSGLYYTGFALFHIPAAFLTARYGLKKMMPFALLLSVLGTVPLIYGETSRCIILGRLLTGVGSSFSPVAAFYLLSQAFPQEKFGKLLGIMVSIGLSAAIYAGAPLAYFIENSGTDFAIKTIIYAGLAFAALSFFLFPPLEGSTYKVRLKDLWKVLANYKIIFSACAAGLMVGAIEGFPDAWGAKFLSLKYSLTNAEAAQVTSCVFLGMLVGCPFCSWLAERTKRYLQTVIFLGTVMSSAFFFILFSPPLPYTMLNAVFIIVGVCCGYQIPALFVASRQVPQSLSVLATTLFNMIVMLFGHIVHTAIGSAVECNGGLDSLPALASSLMIIPAICAVGVIVLFAMSKKNSLKV